MKKKTHSYEELKVIWDQKLKDSGFNDIENADGSTNRPTSRSNTWRDPELREIVQDYYRMAYHFLNEYKFKNKREKVIWEYYAEGLSVRDIADTLRKVRVWTNKDQVFRIVKRLEKVMKEMYLLP